MLQLVLDFSHDHRGFYLFKAELSKDLLLCIRNRRKLSRFDMSGSHLRLDH